jgi:hypothetical protein
LHALFFDPPKRGLAFKGLNGFISLKIELFITTGVRPSNPIQGDKIKTDYSRKYYLWSKRKTACFQIQTFFFFLVSLDGVKMSPHGMSVTTGLLYQPRMTDDDECGAVGGMRIGRGDRSTRRKPAPPPLCPTTNPKIPDLGSNPGPRCGKPVLQ